MIKLVNITKEYILGDEKVLAVDNANLEIKDKEFTSILGSSGSGKSTLMHMIGLLDTPTSGQIFIDGEEVSTLNDDQISKLRNRKIGFVFQQFNLIDKLTVWENVLLPTIYSEKQTGNHKKKSEELLKQFGIWERRNFYPNKISGGQQQRVAIVRALIMNPTLILADEPTGNLDSKTGQEILDLLKKLNQDFGVTVVIITHDPKVAERTKRQIVIQDGKIIKS